MNTDTGKDAVLPHWHKYVTTGVFNHVPDRWNGPKNPRFAKPSQKKIRLNRRRVNGGKKHA